ncbi:MAG: hypothetical protein ACLGH0_01610 [Thermoanaerobaculia bacterium]
MGTWIAAAFIAFTGLLLLAQRRKLAEMQAMILGGSVVPGCVVAEGVVVLLIAVLIAVAHVAGWF